MGVEDWVNIWAEGNGCDPEREALASQGDVSGVRYTGCEEGGEVLLYSVNGGGHAWPGGWPIPGVGRTSNDIDATEEFWRFFQKFQLEQ